MDWKGKKTRPGRKASQGARAKLNQKICPRWRIKATKKDYSKNSLGWGICTPVAKKKGGGVND